MARSTLFHCSLLLLVLVGALCREEDYVAELLQLHHRNLLDTPAPATATAPKLEGRVLAFLTKYEEAFNISKITTNPKAYALWGWQPADKSIKYAIVGGSGDEALTAKNGDEIVYIHLHLPGMRYQNSSDKLVLAGKINGTLMDKDGWKVYAAGSINDAVVAAWNNSLGMKTARDVWSHMEMGHTYTNIHTKAFPDGEARGQNDWVYNDIETLEHTIEDVDEKLLKDATMWRMAFMTSNEETHTVTGNRTGRAMAIVVYDGTKIWYSILAGGQSKDANLWQVTSPADITSMHIHVGAQRGQNSSIIVPLKAPADAPAGAFKTTNGLKIYANGTIDDDALKTNAVEGAPTTAAALWDKIKSGETYLNVYTKANTAGEVRGQVDWNYAAVSAVKAAVPPPGTGANGTGSPTPGASKNFASPEKPCASFLLAAALLLLTLA